MLSSVFIIEFVQVQVSIFFTTRWPGVWHVPRSGCGSSNS